MKKKLRKTKNRPGILGTLVKKLVCQPPWRMQFVEKLKVIRKSRRIEKKGKGKKSLH